MKPTFLPRRLNSGMSLLEITLVLGLILALITALLFGISAFTDGSDRARCIMNLVNVQKAMRSFMNLYEYKPGNTYTSTGIGGLAGTLSANIFGTGKFIDTPPTCPTDAGTSAYQYPTPDLFPAIGTMWIVCPNEAAKGHVPKDVKNL